MMQSDCFYNFPFIFGRKEILFDFPNHKENYNYDQMMHAHTNKTHKLQNIVKTTKYKIEARVEINEQNEESRNMPEVDCNLESSKH